MTRAIPDLARWCPCGARLSRYNPGLVCGVCEKRYGNEMADETRRLEGRPPAVVVICRERGCKEVVTARSAATDAPRWRQLCAEHYDVQRSKNSLAVRAGAVAAAKHARHVPKAARPAIIAVSLSPSPVQHHQALMPRRPRT